jgi:hypothetical protein
MKLQEISSRVAALVTGFSDPKWTEIRGTLYLSCTLDGTRRTILLDPMQHPLKRWNEDTLVQIIVSELGGVR